MTTKTPTRAKFIDDGDQCWAVKSDAGAVEFRVKADTDIQFGISLHQPERATGWGPGDCRLLPAGICWSDVSFTAGRDLYRAWVDERHDDEVIWGALESWHADHFTAKTEA
jgi:hypothetical protein